MTFWTNFLDQHESCPVGLTWEDFIVDTFTAPNGMLLSGRFADTGGVWAETPDYMDGGYLEIHGNACRPRQNMGGYDYSGGSHFYNSASPLSRHVRVAMEVIILNNISDHHFSIVAALNSSGHYFIGSTKFVGVRKYVDDYFAVKQDGTGVTLGFNPFTIGTHRMMVRVNGEAGTYQLWYDDAMLFEDAAYMGDGTGKVGFSATIFADRDKFKIDNFTASRGV